MRNFQGLLSLAVIAVVFFAACSVDNVTGEKLEPDNVQKQAVAAVARPFGGTCDVNAQFTGETTLRISGSCQLTHLGRVSVAAVQTITPGRLGIAYTNETIYTSADGAELRTTDEGFAVPSGNELALTGDVTVIGGTGRFANATGTVRLEGAVHFTSASTTAGVYSLAGTILY